MSVSIEIQAWCADYFGTFIVEGSKAGTQYEVTLSGGGDGLPHCTCPAYKYAKDSDCKHIRKVWAEACLFNLQWKDAGPANMQDEINARAQS